MEFEGEDGEEGDNEEVKKCMNQETADGIACKHEERVDEEETTRMQARPFPRSSGGRQSLEFKPVLCTSRSNYILKCALCAHCLSFGSQTPTG
eukprot:158255-Pyramimonas_sp.AAC.1